MRVLLFRPRFVAPILAGTKRQTIRRPRKVPVHPGEVLSLRYWSGRPYRSPQEEIGPPVMCHAVRMIRVSIVPTDERVGLWIDDDKVSSFDVPAFVRRDGFLCVSDFIGYYRAMGVLSFEGNLIEWSEEISEGE